MAELKAGFHREETMKPVRIIGIGSALGSDQAGWLALMELERATFGRRFPPDILSLHGYMAPANLPRLLAGAALAILVDSMEGPPGSVQRIERDNISKQVGNLSSHGLDVRLALELADSLGQYPSQVLLYGIGIGITDTDVSRQCSPTTIVRDAIPRLTQALQAEIDKFLLARPSGPFTSATQR